MYNPTFAFHVQEDFYTVCGHTQAFFPHHLQKSFDTFHEPLL